MNSPTFERTPAKSGNGAFIEVTRFVSPKKIVFDKKILKHQKKPILEIHPKTLKLQSAKKVKAYHCEFNQIYSVNDKDLHHLALAIKSTRKINKLSIICQSSHKITSLGLN